MSRTRVGRRPGIVYGIRVRHPATGQVVLGYVGQTRQPLEARERQHRDTQPWADTIVGQAYVIEQGVWDDGELDLREQYRIVSLRPLYNIDHNRSNSDRVLPWDAVAQRQARQPGWQHARVPRQRGTQARVVVPRRRWSRRERIVVGVAVLVVVFIAAVLAAGQWPLARTVRDLLGAVALIAGVVWIAKPQRRRKRRRRRGGRR